MGADTSFAIGSVEALHLAFPDGAGYWESYRAGAGVAAAGRFEFRPGWQTVYARHVETPLARVRLKDGSAGWGEANCGIGPEVACLLLENVIGPLAAGREFGHPAALWDFLYDAQRGRGYSSGYYLDAMAALDIAVWDALGRRNGMPVAAMLPGPKRGTVPVYLSGLRRATLTERVALASEWAGSGLRGAKIFLTGDIDAGLAELDGLVSGAPQIEQWMVDTLWMCSYDAAVRGKAEFGARNVKFFECPLQPEDLDGHRRLAQRTGAAIALGEHFRTLYQAQQWFDAPRAVDVYQPDIGRTGISDFVRQRDAALRAGIPVTPHMGTGVSVFQAATLHCAAVSSPELLQEFQGGLSGRLGEASDSAWGYRDGAFALPSRPGLGVELDEAGIGRFAVRR